MTDLRTAAQEALEALEAIREADTAGATPKMVVEARKMYEPTITALRAALAEQPASKPWVGLTEEERTDICDDYGANIHWRAFRAIEAKLQEKNA